MSKYTLTYFVNKGKGEVIRLLLTLKGQEFEDKRVDQKGWLAIKETTPFGQIPVLNIDGKDMTESLAIAMYLAREFDLYGSSNAEMYVIDRVIGLAGDLFFHVAKIFFGCKDEEERKETEKNVKEVQIPRYMAHIETVVSANGNGYCVGNTLTLGDLAVFDIVDGRLNEDELTKYPNVKAISENVKSNPNIKAYLAKRVVTPI